MIHITYLDNSFLTDVHKCFKKREREIKKILIDLFVGVFYVLSKTLQNKNKHYIPKKFVGFVILAGHVNVCPFTLATAINNDNNNISTTNHPHPHTIVFIKDLFRRARPVVKKNSVDLTPQI